MDLLKNSHARNSQVNIPPGDLQMNSYAARNLQVSTGLKQNVEAWEAVSSDIQRALKLHFVDPSLSDMSRSSIIALKQSPMALHLSDVSSPSTMIGTNLQSSGTEAPPPVLATALATQLHTREAAAEADQTAVHVRKANTVLSSRLAGGELSTAARETKPAAAGGRMDPAGQAVLQDMEQEAAGVEQREQEDTLRLSRDSLSSLALLRTESAVQARLSLLQRSLAASIVRDQAPLLRALDANSATADLLQHRAPAGGTGGGQVGGQAAASRPRARRSATLNLNKSAGQGRAPSSARPAGQEQLVLQGQTKLVVVRHDVAAMEQLAAAAAAKSEAAAGRSRRRGVLEAAYRIGCRAYMLHKDC